MDNNVFIMQFLYIFLYKYFGSNKLCKDFLKNV